MYLSKILSKLQMFKDTNFMTFSDGLLLLLLYNFAYKLHTFNFYNFIIEVQLCLFHVCRWNINETAILWNFKLKNIFQQFSDKFDLANKSLELLSFFLLIIVIN